MWKVAAMTNVTSISFVYTSLGKNRKFQIRR